MSTYPIEKTVETEIPVFKKDENKTNEVSNYIGNTSAHITLQKTNIGIITK
jgi:hypothetical protein